MLKLKVLGVLFVFGPTLLWAWGNDIVVYTARRAEYRIPVSYDIMWPNDTTMIAAIACNHSQSSKDTSYIYLFRSSDRGITWPISYVILGPRVRKIQLAHDPIDNRGIILILTSLGDVFLIPFQYANLNPSGLGVIEYGADSTIDAHIATLERNNSLYIYAATTVRSSTQDKLRLYRLVGSQSPINIEEIFSNELSYRQIRDLDVSMRGDTVFVVCGLDEIVRSSYDASVGIKIYLDLPNGNLQYAYSRTYEIGTTGGKMFVPLSVSLGRDGVGLLMFEVGGNLRYVYTTNYFIQTQYNYMYDFPFNTSDSSETLPYTCSYVVFIPVPPYTLRGFNTLFARGNNLYFVEGSCGAQNVNWGSLTLVSDEVPLYSFPGTDEYLNRPSLENRSFLSVPAAIWHSDYFHYSFPIFVYDSTQFVVDNMIANISEQQNSRSFVELKLDKDSRVLTLRFKGLTDQRYVGSIYEVSGRLVKTFEVEEGVYFANVNLPILGSGVYVIALKGERGSLSVNKIVIWR